MPACWKQNGGSLIDGPIVICLLFRPILKIRSSVGCSEVKCIQ